MGARRLGWRLPVWPYAAFLAACTPPAVVPSQRAAAPRALTPEPATDSSAETATVARSNVEWNLPQDVRPGNVYVSVEGQGVLELREHGFQVTLPTKQAPVSLTAMPDGSVLSTFYEYGTARIRGDQVAHLSRHPYSQLAIFAEDDAWGTPDRFAWEIHHFDGKAWKAVAPRAAFKGRFDDNKLNAIAVNQQGVWVSSWNGLFLRESDRWKRIRPPKTVTSDRAPSRLLVHEDRLIASYDAGKFMCVGSRWAKLAWPAATPLEVVSPSGVAAGRSSRGSLSIGRLGKQQPMVSVDISRAGFVSDMDIDEANRIWLVGEHSLLVLDSSGQPIVEYGPGSIPGLGGRIELLAVTAGGPKSLPSPLAPPQRNLRGHVEIYKNGQALTGARVQLCSSITGCDGAPWKRETRTDALGDFEFQGVPSADYYVHVTPRDIPECRTPFTVNAPTSVAMLQDCPPDTTQPCKLPPITACLPFEMPPR